MDQWLNPAAFRLPAQGSFGNLGRNTTFGPGLVQIDTSALKTTRLRESVTLQFRAAFGRILNTLGRTIGLGTARQIQLALKLNY